MKLNIRAISRAILPHLASPSEPSFSHRLVRSTVLSRHTHALNLRTEIGNLVSIVWPEVGKGPFHMTLAEPVDFVNLAPAVCDFDFSQAELWDARLSALTVDSCWVRAAMVNSAVSRQLSLAPFPPLLRLTAALRHGDLDIVRAAAHALAGLGPGLTPAGDDMLVGVMAGLWLAPAALPASLSVAEACHLITKVAIPRTTTLSGAWLRHAAHGEFGEPWHQLAAALTVQADVEAAITRLLAFGASSGMDAFTGFWTWLNPIEI